MADHRKTRVLVILVRSAVTKEEALLVSTTASYPVTRPQDLEIKTALPIDNSFRYVSNLYRGLRLLDVEMHLFQI